jgi:hypothetical protein
VHEEVKAVLANLETKVDENNDVTIYLDNVQEGFKKTARIISTNKLKVRGFTLY